MKDVSLKFIETERLQAETAPSFATIRGHIGVSLPAPCSQSLCAGVSLGQDLNRGRWDSEGKLAEVYGDILPEG